MAGNLLIKVTARAGYTDTPVAAVTAGWQGSYLRPLEHLSRSSEAKDRKNPKKVKCEGPADELTDGWTNQPTDGSTKRGVE